MARFQVKGCVSCTFAFTWLGTYGVEFGFHTGDTAHFIHMDDVSVLKL